MFGVALTDLANLDDVLDGDRVDEGVPGSADLAHGVLIVTPGGKGLGRFLTRLGAGL
jgi:hypothetical protein